LARNELKKAGQEVEDWPASLLKSEGEMLSRMLGRGLAAAVELELDDFEVEDPTAREKVEVTEPLAEVVFEPLVVVLVECDDVSVDFGASDSALSCSMRPWPGWKGVRWSIIKVWTGMAASGAAASACETKQTKRANTTAQGAERRVWMDRDRVSGRDDRRRGLPAGSDGAGEAIV
jgi:hypothetical protein